MAEQEINEAVTKEFGNNITSHNYVQNSLRTNTPITQELIHRLTDPDTIQLLHAIIGLTTEVGELADMYKRHIFYGKPLDYVNGKEELGDISWYHALAVDMLRTTLNEVMTVNINKLRLRYPEKFTEKDAVERNLVAERELLEGGLSNKTRNKCGVPVKDSLKLYSGLSNKTCDKCGVPVKDSLKLYSWGELYLCSDCFNKVTIRVAPNEVQKTNDKTFAKEPKGVFSDEWVKEGCSTYDAHDVTTFSPISKRGQDWLDFSAEVSNHIENYTVKQYGDKGEDQISEWTIEECLKAVSKRIARYGRQSRDCQQELDFKKMAHEIQIAATKYKESL